VLDHSRLDIEEAATMTDLLGKLYQYLTSWFVPEPTPGPSPQPTPEPAPDPPIKPVPAPPSPESSVVAAINGERTSNGLPLLVEDGKLGGTAQSWATSMATATGLDHGDFAGRIASAYPDVAAAENIAEGQPDAASVVAAWMDDPPHRANILGDFNRLGVGADRDEAGSIYWCVDFARVD
jgi:uncharacterized protein YkwD